MGKHKVLSLDTHKYKTTFTSTTTIVLRFSTSVCTFARLGVGPTHFPHSWKGFSIPAPVPPHPSKVHRFVILSICAKTNYICLATSELSCVKNERQTHVCTSSKMPAMMWWCKSLGCGTGQQQLPWSPITKILRFHWRLLLKAPQGSRGGV